MAKDATFRRMILKAFGNLTQKWDFQNIKITVNGRLQKLWNTRDKDLINYMIEKGGDFRNIHSLEDIRVAAR